MINKSNTIHNYKSTPMGIIPSDWEIKKLGDFSSCFSGGTPKTSESKFYNGKIPFIKSGEINNDFTEQTLTEEGVKNSSAKIVESGDLLYALYGANSGDCAISKIRGAINQAILCIRPEADIYFLCSVLELNKRYYYNKYLQGGQGNLSAEIVKSYIIALPSITEQKRISEILSLWDKAIEKQSQLITQLELRKKGLMQQLLTGKKRLSGFMDDYKVCKLEELGIFFKGSGVPKESISPNGIYKCLTYGDLYTKYETFIKDVKSFLPDNSVNKSQQINYGDICFAGSGETHEDIGRCAVFTDDKIGYAGGDIIVFRANKENNPIYLAYLLNSYSSRKQKYALSQGHSVVHIYTQHIKNIKIKIPSRKEQDAMVEVLIQMDNEIDHIKRKQEYLKQQKKGLMQQLLTGEKRIKLENK